MIHFTAEDRQMLVHVVDVMRDRMLDQDGYTERDEATVRKLDRLASSVTSAVVVTGNGVGPGQPGQHEELHLKMFRSIVQAELKSWVPDASQRLLYRAGAMLGIPQPDPSYAIDRDCGTHASDHALVADWVAGVYVYRCSNCFRLFQS